jgi:hypothetical protein
MNIHVKVFGLVCIWLLGGSGCGSRQNTIFIVVPTHFQGPIVIKSETTNGIKLPRKDGVTTIQVPSSGKVEIQQRSPFHQWYNLKAAFSDGQPIMVIQEYDTLSNGVVGLRPIPVTRKGEDWFVVGNRPDADKLHEQLVGFKWGGKAQ